MLIFRGLEEWGRERALRTVSWAMSTPEISASQAGESLRRNPAPEILLIGLYLKMGQFLCATPLIRSLKSSWPRATLHFLGNPVNTVAARANPHLDKVWVWNKSAFLEWPNQLRELKKERFNLSLLLTTDRPSATGVLIARTTGAEWVAGYVPSVSDAWAQEVTSLFHIRIPAGGEKNEVQKFLGLGRALGVAPDGRQPEFVPAASDDSAADTFLSAQSFSTTGPLVGLFIGGKAERSDRLWPVAHFARLAETLMKAGYRVIAISPPPPKGTTATTFLSDEHLRLEEFHRTLTKDCPVFQEASLGRVAAFIKRLDLLVCPDGGILHLAAAVGIPTLGLYFSTDPEVWRHDVRQAIIDARGKPSSELSVETVSNEIFRFLQHHK